VRSPFSREPGTWVHEDTPDGGQDIVAVVCGRAPGSGTAAASVIGRRLTTGAAAAPAAAGTAAVMRDALAGEGIAAGTVSAPSPRRLTCAVPAVDADRAVIRLHRVYVEQTAVHDEPVRLELDMTRD
jgi:aspartokinase